MHPLRRRVLRELAAPDSAAGVARRLGEDRRKVNYHVRQLEAEGLVEVVEERVNRGCTERLVRGIARSYLLDPLAADDPENADPAVHQDRFSSAHLVSVAARVVSELSRLRELALARGMRLATLTLESEVRFATPGDQHAFGRELAREVARLTAKYHDDTASKGRAYRLMTGVYPVPPGESASDGEVAS